jgi:hypothetical protein
MKAIRPGLILLVVQLVLVLSVAGKYLYERQSCPRLWTRAAQFDPSLPLRGRYLALQLLVDACSLPRDTQHAMHQYPHTPSFWQWNVSLNAVHGTLVPSVAEISGARRSDRTLTLRANTACERATLDSEAMLFVPDRAPLPLPLKPGQDLWVEVTLPPSGPPRPIQIAVSSAAGFRPLKLN